MSALGKIPPSTVVSTATVVEKLNSNISTTGALQMGSHTIVAGENYTNLQSIMPDINFNINEEDFDDEDEDFDDDFSDDYFEDDVDAQTQATESDMTRQLLDFTQQVNTDIQKYFGPKKDDDSCDIYEDKWKTKKSGRELYLADILRIANGGETNDESKRGRKLDVQSRKTDLGGSSGKVNKSAGLGPLDELFKELPRDPSNKGKKPKRLQHNNFGSRASLQERKLPTSFWLEPSRKQESLNGPSLSKSDSSNIGQGKSTSQAPATPDFSDLLDSWAGEEPSSSGTATQTTAVKTTLSAQTPAVVS